MNDPLLVAEDVTKRYARGRRSILALHDVTLAIAAGEFVSVHGLEPHGRAALTLVLAGLAQPDKGTIRYLGPVEGRPLRDDGDVHRNRRTLVPRQIAVCSDRFAPGNGSTLLTHVALPLRLRGSTRAEANSAASEVLERVGASGVSSSHPHDVEAGDRVRVAIARAIVHRPRIILLNDLTSGVALIEREPIVGLLRSLAHEDGMVVLLMAAHLVAGPDRALAIHSGVLRGQAQPSETAEVLPFRRAEQ